MHVAALWSAADRHGRTGGGLYLLAPNGMQAAVLRLGPGTRTRSTVLGDIPFPIGIAIDAAGNVYTMGDELVREYVAG